MWVGLSNIRVGSAHLGEEDARHVWVTADSDEASFCIDEFVRMNPTLWNDQNMFLKTLKIRVYHKNSSIFYKQSSDINCWWERLLVVALKYLKGIKHTDFYYKITRRLQALKLTLSFLFFSLHLLYSYLSCFSNDASIYRQKW